MEPRSTGGSAGGEGGQGLAGAFDSAILDLRSSKELAAGAAGGPIPAVKVSPPLSLSRQHMFAFLVG